MKKLRSIIVSIALIAGISVPVAAFVAPGIASASSQEAKWQWDSNWNWMWVNWDTGTDFITTLQAQVQNNNIASDAFTIRICNSANCPTYGPIEIGRGDWWLQTDVINGDWGVPGFIDQTTVCEYDVGCTTETLEPWGN